MPLTSDLEFGAYSTFDEDCPWVNIEDDQLTVDSLWAFPVFRKNDVGSPNSLVHCVAEDVNQDIKITKCRRREYKNVNFFFLFNFLKLYHDLRIFSESRIIKSNTVVIA